MTLRMQGQKPRDARATGSAGLRRDAAENRARLLQAAERVFAERGTDVSMEDIARAAGVGPATLYRRFPNKEALVAEVLTAFFSRLIALAEQAATQPATTCLDTYLVTVGWELAANRGLVHGAWGDLAPHTLVTELETKTGRILERAQSGGGIDAQVTVGDIAAAVWALRGIIHTSAHAAPDAWRRHITYLLAGFHKNVDHSTRALTPEQITSTVTPR
ncbi:helix-turn-helix domain-containing protein [Streptomyces sp. H10-C2]|uniref:TetR/AcrR family transcriptional regulator n=1 Tax=unclassified Streptomyces TaxID=2593676 RepID=UPI0024BB8219|nr:MULTISPECIES: helix-turn-helix domain-containing protein [unclassified Streptomyces]MDJ0345370.1 helix-turn-helix domain-containing protein [Streptomyces sp. PH10-H1]MDJ0372125.1 helix-turn-helix domain-containing protein [Streptomyces sp. H10-C2]